MDITHDELLALVHYDPETGIFTNRSTGQRLDKLTSSGYARFYIAKINFIAHRAAWLYMTGSAPTAFIDHANHDRGDNRWSNLREASPAQSSYNRKGWGKTGFKGVSKEHRKYVASGSVDGKRVRLGSFDTPEAAHEAYVKFTTPLAGEFLCSGSTAAP